MLNAVLLVFGYNYSRGFLGLFRRFIMTKRYNTFDRRSDKLLFEGKCDRPRQKLWFEQYDTKSHLILDYTDHNVSYEFIDRYNDNLRKKGKRK